MGNNKDGKRKIPLLDLAKQIAPIRAEIDAAIKNVIDSGAFIGGKEVAQLERSVAEYSHTAYAVGCSNGTDSIRLALIALGVKPGDGVLCPAFTYFATAGAVTSIGAIPVFTDICPDTFTISPESIAQTIAHSKKIPLRAIIPVHLYGLCADMDSIMPAAKEHNLSIIEDTAQAFGASYKMKKAGSIGDCGSISFFPGKNLGAFGDAGMVITNNIELAENMKVYRNQGNKERYFHEVLGFNHRLDTMQAAVLNVKLKYIDAWNSKRAHNADYYNRQLHGLPLVTPSVPAYTTHIYHQYVLRAPDCRDRLIEHLQSKGIDSRIYYPLALHLQPCFNYLGYKKGAFPVSEKASDDILAIPVYPDLSSDDLDYIVSSIKEFFV